MHQPFYFRPPEYRYTLRSEMGYRWWTGVLEDDRQFWRGVGTAVTFDRAGKLLRVEEVESYPIPPEWYHDPSGAQRVRPPWAVDLDFEECPIRVRRFWVPERWLGIEDMPKILSEYFTDREAFLAHGDVRAEDAESWKALGQFVFLANGGDYWINSRGDVETS